MARISGIDLPKNKRIDVALTYIYGIGDVLSKQILEDANVKPDTRVFNLTEDEAYKIQEVMLKKGIKSEGDLKKEVSQDIKRLMDIGCYRGMRHRKGLPVRGQRTRSNARTRKGPRKTVGAKVKVE
ncbi:MAG TPA: 30S ribosomal protein S13 [Candidatus Goldiibacteriota bacterium]|nr:30S ribosomal protein S13 [Candidatus Goldiibacteriota bacterium]HRQ42950.1 30S ribosomal protein S13 [Candidatus Goldiibacteriota bacterium]